MSLEMYQQNILDHAKHPRNFGTLESAEHARVTNPLCGDELEFYLQFDEAEKISDVKFSGRGCTISMASASMLSEKLKSLTRSEIEHLKNENILEILGVEVNPARMRCATLSLEAVQQAIGHH